MIIFLVDEKTGLLAKPGMSQQSSAARDTAYFCSMLHNRLMSVLHERSVQLRLTDREGLDLSLRGRNRRRLKQRGHPPVGSP